MWMRDYLTDAPTGTSLLLFRVGYIISSPELVYYPSVETWNPAWRDTAAGCIRRRDYIKVNKADLEREQRMWYMYEETGLSWHH